MTLFPCRFALFSLALAVATLMTLGTVAAEPDFTPSDLAVEALVPEVSAETTLTATVTNSGSTGEVEVRFLVNGVEVDNTTATVAADASQVFTGMWTPDAVGEVTIGVKLVADNETHTTDNQMSRKVQVYRALDETQNSKDRIVGSGETTEVTYYQDGLVVVRSSGTLIINDGGTFTMGQQRAHELYILVEGSGTLIIEDNATLKSNRPLRLFLADDATLEIRSGGRVEVAELVARNRTRLEVDDGTLKGSVDFAGAALALDRFTYNGNRASLSATMPVTITDSHFTADSLSFAAAGDVTITNSSFVVEELAFAPSGRSDLSNSTFSQSLDSFVSGTHTLVNVETPGVKVDASGDATVLLKWYLTVAVHDVGNAPIINATVQVISKDDRFSEPKDAMTDKSGTATFLLDANVTTADAGNDFVGNYKVTGTYAEVTVSAHATLDRTQTVVLRHPARVDRGAKVTVTFSVLGEEGNQFVPGTEATAVCQVRWQSDGQPAVEVAITLVLLDDDGKEMDSLSAVTDDKGRVTWKVKLPEESGGYRVKATYTDDVGLSGSVNVAGEEGITTTTWVLIGALFLVVIGLAAVMRFTALTHTGTCEECGSRIPLNAMGQPSDETCAECGTVLMMEPEEPEELEEPAEPEAEEA